MRGRSNGSDVRPRSGREARGQQPQTGKGPAAAEVRGAAAHDVDSERLPPAVPKRVDKDLIVLDGNRANGGVEVKRAALEHHAVLVVDTGALREHEEGCRVGGVHVLVHALVHQRPILHLHAAAAALATKGLVKLIP